MPSDLLAGSGVLMVFYLSRRDCQFDRVPDFIV